MEKKNGLTASFIGVAAVWIGGHFGPGFATGTSMTTWFVRYGAIGLILPLISMAITGGVMYFMVEFARRNKSNNYKAFAASAYGDKNGKFVTIMYDVVFLVTVMCAGGLCISGLASLLEAHLGLPYWGGAAVTVAISAILCLYGSKLLSKASAYMMYFIIGVTVLVVVMSFAFGSYDLAGAFANSSKNAIDSSFVTAIWKAVLYGFFQSSLCFNVISVSDVLEDNAASKKAIGIGYLINIVLMCLVILMLFSYTNIFAICQEKLPIYTILTNLGFGWLTWAYVALMTLAVLSSAAGLAYAGTVRFDSVLKGIGSKKARSAIIAIVLLGLATFAASFGLKSLMSTGNSIIGYLSIVIIVIPAYTLIRGKLKAGVKQ